MKKKVSACKLRDELVSIMRELGFKRSDRETTKGAVKVWMERRIEHKESFLLSTLAEVMQDAIPSQHPQLRAGDVLQGDDFEAEIQSYDPRVVTVFIACYRDGSKGLAYSMGIDC